MAADLKTKQERNVRAMKLRPAAGRGTATTHVRLRPGGTTCDIEDGSWRLVADMDAGSGGADLGPDPGVFARSGLGACLAIGYALWAARLEVPLDDVEVTIEADYDARGMYAVDDAVTPGWQAVRCNVSIVSSAPEARIRDVVEMADRHSPVLDDMTRPLTVERTLHIEARAVR